MGNIDSAKLNKLLSISKPSVCEILKVSWSDDDVKFYGWARYDEIAPFAGNLPLEPIEARLISGGFYSFEINSGQTTDSISITFDDIDKDISNRFQTYGAAIRCELFYFYPEPDLLISVFFGTLNKPAIFGYKTVETTITNGYRSRELMLPRRALPNECTAIFGGKFKSLKDLETNGCQYNRHLGGTNGTLNPETNEPWTDCPRQTKADCVARWTDSASYLGLEKNLGNVVSDQKTGFVAVTRGNDAIFKTPIRVILGRKFIRNVPVLFWRAEAPDYIRVIYLVGEGSLDLLEIESSNTAYNPSQVIKRYGEIRQASTGYEAWVQPPIKVNFSATSVLHVLHGSPGGKLATQKSGQDIITLLRVHGDNKVAVFSDEENYTRTFTVNAAWNLLECHTNKRWGLGYTHDRFNIPSFISAASWADVRTRFTHSSTGAHYDSSPGESRASFSAVLEARPSHEQITDICRSMRLSVPFQHDGQYHIAPIAGVSDDILENAKVFADKGENRNIVWTEGKPSITFSQVADDKLTNHIELTFEDGTNADQQRPITIDDPDQKARAGRALGDNNFLEVPKKYAAFGIRFLNEAIKLGFSLLWFGEFDSGGLKNNLSANFTTPFEQTLGLKRYEIIKIESDLLTGFSTPEGNPFKYFRIMNMRKSGINVEMRLQAYNKEAYENFETELPSEDYLSIVNPALPVQRLQFGSAPYYESGKIVIPPISE